ncbi:septal ring lytic transglycosylase RlpA family protein [Rhizobium sp. TRM95111]|uniref:septal ring lytic transglycosylase RlpA family protein n=1 Tax=Rhizobium alarense TaxID=2846851 RepID=UPI001F292F7A|nr:septal ring lytic transglycosylase RlpA family protein [Rhizobium alarense]MCF3638694.1 septal ring lytic transglycosylase RlpA family protein [Rhizobium alarense]
MGLGLRLIAIPMVCVGLAACSTTSGPKKKAERSKEYFSESEYGVKASARVVEDGKPVPKGGGRFQVGKPYKVKGRWYQPKEEPGYDKTGMASWYGSAFHGRRTANGEVYDKYHLSAAHPTFPLPSYARVTNLENGTSVMVRVNDRGPFSHGRLIDVSSKTADLLDMKRSGTAKVRVQYVGPARMDGHDMPYLMASYVTKGSRVPAVDPGGQIATGVMVASADPGVGLPGVDPVSQPQATGESATMTALAENKPATAAFQALEQFVLLPEIGPLPAERPVDMLVPGEGVSYAAAYADTRVRDAAGAFDAILHLDGSLTPLSGLSGSAG